MKTKRNYKGKTCSNCNVQVSIGSKLGFCRNCCPKFKHTPESKEKLRLSKLGSKNPMFGIKAWNKGIKMESITGEKNHQWKGGNVSYTGLHHWVYRELGKPLKCLHCSTTEGRIEWANKSQNYLRDLTDWISLCKKCHIKYDDVLNKSWKTRKSYAVA